MRNAQNGAARPGTFARMFAALAWAPIIWACSIEPAKGQSVTLAWDRDSSHTNLLAYLVKFGGTSGSYTGQVSVATNFTSATVSNLASGRTYYFAVTALSTAGLESDPSNEVVTNTPNRQPVAVAAAVSTSEDQSVGISLAGTDPDSDPLIYSIATSPANGTLNGAAPNLTYVPSANYSGADSFTFRVNDGLTNSIPATISITVNPVNDAPTLTAINNLSISEDAGQQTVNLSGIGSGAGNENQTLAVTASSSNIGLIPNPTVSYTSPNNTGSLSFTPVANASGTASITVTVNDGQAQNNSLSRTFTITVIGSNDAPTLNALGNLTINEDSGVQTVNLSGISPGSANESQTLTVTASSSNTGLIPNPTVSYASPNATGTMAFTPLANANGTATLTVTVNDGQSQNNTVTRTFTVTVTATNDTPTLTALSNLSIGEDASQQTVSLAGIGSGAANESQTLTVTATSSNTGLIPNPTVSHTSPSATGTLTFTPIAHANGTATISVMVNDGQSQNNIFTRTFTVTVNAVNDAPTLDALVALPLSEDAPTQTVNLTGISSGAGNESQILTVTATSSNPTLVPNPTVSYTSPSATGSLTLKPATNATGTATITVTVNDGQSQNNSVARTFNVTVNGVNDAPSISNIADQTINESTSTAAIAFTVGDNETAANSLNLSASSSNPALVPTTGVVFGGSGVNRTVTLTPVSTMFGTTVITIQVSDANGGSATDTFTVTVNPVNQAPTLGALSNVTIAEDATQQAVTLSGISTGSINENDPLTVTASSSNTGLIPNPTVTYTSPTSTGTLTFTPAANANGTATITVTVNDGQSQNNTLTRTFNVTVSAVNDVPTLNTLTDLDLDEDSGSQSVSIAGIGAGAANETQTLVMTAVSSSAALIPNPTVTYTSPNSTGTLTLRPTTNATGTATITVTVNDGQSQNNTVTRTFSVNVAGANDLPIISDIANQTINENTSTAAIPFVIGDIETAAAGLTLAATSSNPTLLPNANIVLGGSGANRSVTATPVSTLFGSTVVTIQVADSDGGTAIDTFTLTVTGVNQAPTLDALNNLSIAEDAGSQSVSLSGISSGATNESQILTVTAVSSNPGLIPTPSVAYISPNSTGSITFAPVANSNGTATFTVTVNDGQSLNNTVIRTFAVTVNAVNDAPTISDITNQSISQNSTTALLPFTVGDVETSASGLAVAAISSNPTLVPTANIALGGSGANRTVRVTPALNQFGSAIVSLTVSDGSGEIASDSFVVNVSAGNQPPTLDVLNDLTIVEDAGAQMVALTGISSGSVNESQTLALTVVSSNPALIPNPTLNYASPNATGSISFTPVTNAHGSATITVVVNDGQSLNNAVAETFVVTVNPVNDAPTLNPIANVSLNQEAGPQIVALSGVGSGAANENQTLSVTALSSDPDLIPNPTVSYFTPNATGTLGFTPAVGAIGTATITVTVDDGQSANNTAVRTFTVTVSGSNQPPTITDIADRSIPVNSPAISVQTVVGDFETPAINLQMRVTSSNPSLVPTNNIAMSNGGSNRVVNIISVLNQSGVTIITVTVTDADGGVASDSFVLTVIAPNARPTLDPLTDLILNEDSGLRAVNLTGVSDGSASEEQTLIVSAVSDNPAVVPHPAVSYSDPNFAGILSFTPTTNASGSAYITVTVNDGQNQNNLLVRSFRVWVNAVNDAPTISPVPNQLVENNSATTTLPFVINDVETPATSLSVSASSSNPALVPNANIVLGGSGANRTVKVTPAPLQSGTAAISIYATDGALTAAGVFLVTVGSTNTPPEIDAPAALATDSYTPLPDVPIVVADSESRPEDLVLTVTSYNQTVLPSTNIIITGTGSNRFLTLKPVAGKSGEVSLSFGVSDGRIMTRSSCQLTVEAGTAPKAKLSVRKKGRGAVQPALDGQDLTIGESYTLTAVPASDELFTGWSGSVTSLTRAVTFIMASNTVLEASFTNSPYLSAKGTYNGLFYEVAEVKHKSSGSFTIAATERGTYTGKLKLGLKSYSLSGQIDLQCKATNTIVRTGFSTLSVELDFAGGATNQVVGRVTDTLWEAPLLGDRSYYNSKTNVAPFAGSYTLIVPGQDALDAGPEGDGVGTVKVDGSGLATLIGTLADGTKVSQKVPLSRGGQWPLYIPLYGGTGSVLSWLTVTNRVTDDINGLLSWIKPTESKAKHYAAGFTNESFVIGSLYIRPVSSTNRVLNLSQADIMFGGGNLEKEWTNIVLWSSQNKITNLSDNMLTMTVVLGSGLFSGSVVDPSTGKPVKFSGALLQKLNTGSGFSLGVDRSARVVIQE